MITILVGEAKQEVVEEINFGSAWGKMLPCEQVKEFEQYYNGIMNENYNVVIRVYTDTIINWVGEQIEAGNIKSYQVYIHTPGGGVHYFNSKGHIDNTWPHGIFNY
jgi:hypothetical protein